MSGLVLFIVGVGTGSTTTHFIEALWSVKHQIEVVVSSSKASSTKLNSLSIPIFDLNTVICKSGGAALTREKVIAAVARKFVLPMLVS